jgi:ethanolamine ammonia-lyase small subunit
MMTEPVREKSPSPGSLTRSDLSPRAGRGASDDPWAELRALTCARIGLTRTGPSLATAPLLDFQLAHARARDAVHASLDVPRLVADLGTLGLPAIAVASVAPDHRHYLMRPDLGRALAQEARAALRAHAGDYDVVFVVADGLSAGAVQSHAQPVLALALSRLRAKGLAMAPLIVVRHGRVAVGDAIAAALGAKSVVVLIGERPGLSAPDSMGAYLTWQPQEATTDGDRNCISNIRPQGTPYVDAVFKLTYLIDAMHRQQISGVNLKDQSDRLLVDRGEGAALSAITHQREESR